MTKLLLTVHVLAVILAVGPVAVAASMFPAVARRAAAGTDADHAVSAAVDLDAGPDPGSGDPPAGLRLLHRICRVYATAAIAVPVFGIATASSLGVLPDPWVLGSVLLTGAAAAVLTWLILPGQAAQLVGPATAGRRLAAATGGFNLLWVAVTVLMVTRPGSTLEH